MIRWQRSKTVVTIGLVLALVATAGWARQWSKEYEKKVGDQAVAEIAKEYEALDAPEQQQQVESIVAQLVPHTQRPDLEYKVHLLDSPEVNAFSVPAGNIYFAKGLLDAVESEEQLAGVIAHEMAHVCTYDVLDQLERTEKMSLATAAALIVVLATGHSDETIYSVLTAGQVVSRGIMSKYSVEIESRADYNAVSYLLDSGYDPVGLLTFMERLSRQERSGPTANLGIFRTHPLSPTRVTDIIDLLEEAGVEINRRAVTDWDPPVVEKAEVGGKPAQILKLWGEQLFAFDYAPEDGDVAARGQRMVEVLTKLLRAGVRIFEFRITKYEGQTAIVARRQRLLTVYPEDADLVGKSVGDTAIEVTRGIRQVLYWERIEQAY